MTHDKKLPIAMLTLVLAGCGGASYSASEDSDDAAGGESVTTTRTDTTPSGGGGEGMPTGPDAHAPPPMVALSEDYDALIDTEREANEAMSLADCESAEGLVERICELKERICEIAEEEAAGDADAEQRCEDAAERCRRSQQRFGEDC
jgi:hypothetical protein